MCVFVCVCVCTYIHIYTHVHIIHMRMYEGFLVSARTPEYEHKDRDPVGAALHVVTCAGGGVLS